MQIGTMSVLLEFLDIKSRMMFNHLCKHVYRVVMPAVSGKFFINTPKQFGEWLEWGKNDTASKIKLQRSLSIEIGGDKGTYYGEQQVFGDKVIVSGRGVLDCGDKLILGYAENGEWMDKSTQVICYKKKWKEGQLQVLKLGRSRPGGI